MVELIGPDEFVKSIGYDLIRRLGISHGVLYSSCAVYEAANGSPEHVTVKTPSGGNQWWNPIIHLNREHEVLERLRGLRGIQRVEDFYDESDGVALVKNYIPGEVMNGSRGDKITSLRGQMVAENIVRSLHDEGYARLEFCHENVVMYEDIPFLIDTGSVVRLGDWKVDIPTFCAHADDDLRALEKMCD